MGSAFFGFPLFGGFEKRHRQNNPPDGAPVSPSTPRCSSEASR